MFKVVRMNKVQGTGKILAYLDIEVGGLLVVKGFKVVDNDGSLFIGAPQTKDKNGKYWAMCYTASEEAKAELNKAGMDFYNGNGVVSSEPTQEEVPF